MLTLLRMSVDEPTTDVSAKSRTAVVSRWTAAWANADAAARPKMAAIVASRHAANPHLRAMWGQWMLTVRLEGLGCAALGGLPPRGTGRPLGRVSGVRQKSGAFSKT